MMRWMVVLGEIYDFEKYLAFHFTTEHFSVSQPCPPASYSWPHDALMKRLCHSHLHQYLPTYCGKFLSHWRVACLAFLWPKDAAHYLHQYCV